MNRLELTGLTARPSQVWGGVRLVPLVREEPVAGLRLHREVYERLGPGVVELGPRTHDVSYIPHGLVADWSGDGEGNREGAGVRDGGGQSAAYGTQLGGREAPRTVRLPRLAHHRMAKRRPGDRLRFLPLHLGPLVWITPGSRAPARASAALSSITNAPRCLNPPPCSCTHRTPLPDPA